MPITEDHPDYRRLRDQALWARQRSANIAFTGAIVGRVAVGIYWCWGLIRLLQNRELPFLPVRIEPSLISIGLWLVVAGPLLLLVGRVLLFVLIAPVAVFAEMRGSREARAAGIILPRE